MIETFLSTLTPMLTLFLFMAIGFTITKTKIIPENASKVIAKLLTYVSLPALSFASMAKNFRIEYISTYASLILLCLICLFIAIGIAMFLAKILIKDKFSYERNIYKYALTFGNYGYVGTPLVIAIFGLKGYSFFSFITLTCGLIVYSWGINILIPKQEKQDVKTIIKNIFNPAMIGLIAGIIFGLTGLGEILYTSDSCKFIANCVDDLSNCMAPLAMLLAGITVAKYDVKKMLSNKKIYIATVLRLVLIPLILTPIAYGIICLVNLLGWNLDKTFLYLFFFVIATPLGMNTIVFPEAYGGDPSTGASLTLVSHILSVITIPLMFGLLSVVFGPIPIF